MPSLTTEELEKIDVPNVPGKPQFDDTWVVLDVSPMKANDTEEVDQGVTAGSYGIRMMANRIREWNIPSGLNDGKMAPITAETVGQLHIDQYKFLADKIKSVSGEFDEDQKKTLSNTSQQSIEVKTLE